MYHKKRHRGLTTLLHVLVCIPMLLGPTQPVIGHRISQDVSTVEVSGGPDLATLAQNAGRAFLQTSSITIQSSNFEGNKDYGLNSNIIINAENNWWGNANGPTHASNPQGRGDAVSDNVDFDPWLPSAVNIGIPYSPPPGPGVITLSQNSFEDNGSYGVQSSIPVNAEYNWWGHPSGPYHPDTNPDGQGDAVSDLVDYEPWLASPPGMRRPTALTLGQPLKDSVAPNHYKDYKLVTAAGLSIVVEVMSAGGSETLWVYSRLGDLPLWTRYDLRTQEKTARGAYELLLSPTQNGTYYFSVYGRDVADTGGNYQIVANTVERYLSDVSPDSAGNAGEVTLTLSGLPFVDGIGIELRGAGLPTFAADSVTLASPISLWAHFDLNGATTGVYDVYAVWPGGAEASLTDAFTVTTGTGPHLEAHLVAPEAIRPGRQYVLHVEYANTGDADMPAPLLRISAENASLRLPEQDNFAGSSIQLFATNPDGPFGVLPPGVSGRLSLIFKPGDSGGTARFSVSKLEANTSVTVGSIASTPIQEVPESDGQPPPKLNVSGTAQSPLMSPTAVDESVLIDNAVFAAIERFYTSHIQALLEEQESGLATYQVEVLGKPKPAAEIIMNASIGYDYMINPKILLAILESINGLVTDPSPSQDKLDFAMGNSDKALRGFENQVNWAAREMGRSYKRYYYRAPAGQRYLAASLALQELSRSLPDRALGERLLNSASPQSVTQSYQRLFSTSPRVAPQDVGDLSIEQLSFMQRPFNDHPEIRSFFDHEPGVALVTVFTGSVADVPYQGHQGLDYGLGWNEPISAAATGNIAHAGIAPNENRCLDGQLNPNGAAKYVATDHDLNNDDDPDFRILYWHLDSNTRPDGTDWEDNDPVDAGDQIGLAGNTGIVTPCPNYAGDPIGTHLHFEVKGDPNIFVPGGSVYTGQSMDPFGWWGTTRDDPVGTPYSRWLWESSATIDDLDTSFEKFGTGWEPNTYGAQGHAWLANRTEQWGVWGLKALKTGDYYVQILIPDIQGKTYRNGKYSLFVPSDDNPGHADEVLDNFMIDQEKKRDQWVRLGGNDASPIRLEKGEVTLVKLSTPAGSGGTYTVFDAVRLLDARPIAPTNLTASATGERSIHLEWTDNATNETGFKVFRDGEAIATVGTDVASYDDNGLICGTTYRYYVKAFNSAGDSDSSNVSVAATAGCPPGSFLEELLSWIISRIIRPVDPNDKVGPLGHGNTRTVSSEDTLHYTVNFENLATATAPVQELVVDDYLDPNLDWTTFQFDDIAYGDRIIVMPEDVFEFSGRDVPTSTSITGTTQGPMVIDMTASLDPETGRVEWRLGAIDTATEMPPEDPFAGFLPPEDGTGRGQGHVGFSIKPQADVALGARITNTASIVFDTNDPIDTNEVWNTIGEPSSLVYLPIVLRRHP